MPGCWKTGFSAQTKHPQGPLSPLLSNVVLDELNHELDRRGHRYVSYADDVVHTECERGCRLWAVEELRAVSVKEGIFGTGIASKSPNDNLPGHGCAQAPLGGPVERPG
jgi:hypothetical protein